MHAVSRDAEAFGRPCVYIQLDEGSEHGMPAAADEGEEEEEEELTAELRLVPAEEAAGGDLTMRQPSSSRGSHGRGSSAAAM